MDALGRRVKNSYDSHVRRAKAAGQHIRYTRAELQGHVEPMLGLPCTYCRTIILDQDNFSCDHAQPIARSGSFDICNVRVCCSDCNLVKGLMNEHEYRSLVAIMAQMPPVVRLDLAARLKHGGGRFGR